MNVLIIDDDPDVVDVIKLSFDQIPHAHVFVSHNEQDANVFLARNDMHLIILDLMMPGSNGFDICKKIRAIPELQAVKILAITGYDTPEYKKQILRCGANDYLAKPFTIQDFSDRIRKLCETIS